CTNKGSQITESQLKAGFIGLRRWTSRTRPSSTSRTLPLKAQPSIQPLRPLIPRLPNSSHLHRRRQPPQRPRQRRPPRRRRLPPPPRLQLLHRPNDPPGHPLQRRPPRQRPPRLPLRPPTRPPKARGETMMGSRSRSKHPFTSRRLRLASAILVTVALACAVPSPADPTPIGFAIQGTRSLTDDYA